MHAYVTIAAAAVVLAAAIPAAAHHSNSAYQVDKIITLEGTVKEWRWMNPHTWLILEVTGADGKKQEWAVEGRPPGILGRAGWSGTILQPGERVTVHASPAKNGDPEAIIALERPHPGGLRSCCARAGHCLCGALFARRAERCEPERGDRRRPGRTDASGGATGASHRSAGTCGHATGT